MAVALSNLSQIICKIPSKGLYKHICKHQHYLYVKWQPQLPVKPF